MCTEIIAFDDNEIEIEKCYHLKNLILLEDVDTDKIRVSNMAIIKIKHYA